MKKLILLFSVIVIVGFHGLRAQISKTIHVETAGTLSTLFTAEEKTTVTDLIITGTLNDADFLFFSNMPALLSIDMEMATVIDNKLPMCAFIFLGLTSVILPESITYIGKGAFAYTKLRTLYIPSSVVDIEQLDIVSGCDSLESINVDASNPSFSSIDGVLFNKSQTELLIFALNKRWKNYAIPEGVERIDYYAFQYEMKPLDFIIIPASVKVIESLSSWRTAAINVHESNPFYSSKDGVLFNKDQSALIKIPWLKSGEYSVPNTVNTIGSYAFSLNKGMTTLIIPESVIEIGESNFESCQSLDSIKVSAGNANYSSKNGVLFNKDQSVLISCPRARTGLLKIPFSVVSIADEAFSYCYKLSEIAIPYSVTQIGISAFYSCNELTEITIPSSVIKLSNFSIARNIILIKTNSAVPIVLDELNVFDAVDKTVCILYVPRGSKSLYSEASGWKDFLNIEEFDFELTVDDELSMASEEDSEVDFDIASTTEWKMDIEGDWLFASDTAGVDNATLTLTATANTSTSPRFATITITGLGIEPQTITVTQAGSEVTSAAVLKTSAVRIFPNPVIDHLNIEYGMGLTAALYDLQGKLILTKRIETNKEVLDMTGVARGIYLFQVGDISMKIIK